MSYITSVALDNVSLNLIKDNHAEIAAVTGGLAYYSLHKLMLKDGLATTNIKFNLGSSILAVIVSYLFWKEPLTNKKILGFSLALVSLYLINKD